jgi:hypothetical protein
MRNKWVLLIAALVLSLACTSQAIVVGDFEGGFDGWLPAGASTLTLSTTGATSGAGSLLIEGPGSWQMLAKLDIKSLRATLGVADAAVSIDVTALAADMRIRPLVMNMEVIINGQNNNDSGAHNNIGWQSLGALDIVGNGVPQTLRWEVPDDLSAKIAGTDDNIQWFELFIITNNRATNTKIYVDNIRLLGTKPQPPAGPKIVWVSFHGADDAPSAGAAGDGFTEAPDKGYTDLLKANGYDVTRYIQTSTPDVNVLNAADLVIVSRSVALSSFENAAATAWNGISAPMIIVGSGVMHTNRLGFVTGDTISHITGDITLTVNDPTHPIFTGISLTNGTMTNPFAGVVVYPTDGTKAHGNMIATSAANANGTVLATVSAAGNGPAGVMIIAEWPAGATLTHDGGAPATDVLAGHRLVFQTSSCTPSGKSVETQGMYDLYPDGAQMFLNAVQYMLK